MANPNPNASRAPATLAREAGRRVFGDGAAGYHAIRLGYPDELFEHLRKRAGNLDSVLEIGPGSGLATDGLLRFCPRRYVGVESDPGFVEFLRQRYPAPYVELICAPFPCPGLVGPFDLAACAAAFHWLDPVTSLEALRQLLRPGGIWAMWWNSYLDETDDHPFGSCAMALLRSHGVQFPPSFGPSVHLALDVGKQVALLEHNGFTDVESRQWRACRTLGAAAARELFDSFSFIRVLPKPDREGLLDNIEATVTDRFGGKAENWVSTTCYTARPA